MSTNSITGTVPATAPARPVAGSVSPLQRGIVALLGGMLLLAACAFHFSRNVTPGQISPDAMETVEAARNFARTRHLITGVVRPLVLYRIGRANPDGRLPDTSHAPLYPMLAGTLLKVTNNTGPSQGDRMAAGLSLACFVGSLIAAYLLALRLFGSNGALLGCGLYALGAGVVSRSLEAHPAMLATALFTFLLGALYALDVKGTKRRAPLWWAAGAGILWSLLFLTIYSALLLLVPLAAYVWIVTKKDRRALVVFLLAAVFLNPLVLALGARNLRLTGNPLFNAHLLELPMGTETYPGTSLYRAFGMEQSIPQFLASGGVMQIVRKAGGNVVGYYENLPGLLGVLVLPLFLVAALTRFTNPAVNRMRTLIYVLMGVHVLGLSLFVPYQDGLPLLLIYAPFVALIGTVFFLNFLRARNLPSFYARAALAAWVTLACVPGLVRLLAPGPPNDAAAAYAVYGALNTGSLAARVEEVRQTGGGVIVSDVPREMAYNVGVPVLWLPRDYSEVRVAGERLNQPVRGIVLTPALNTPALADPQMLPWRTTWNLVSAFVTSTSFFTDGLSSIKERDALNGRALTKLYNRYLPAEVRDMVRSYQLQQPVSEDNNSQASLIWWEPVHQARANVGRSLVGVRDHRKVASR